MIAGLVYVPGQRWVVGLSALLLVAAGACERGATPRVYEEAAPAPLPVATPAAAVPGFSWTTPANWLEKPGQGVRLAVWTVGATGECTLITLPGEAGGLPANVNRWIAQLNLSGIGPAERKRVLAAVETVTTADNRPGELVDLLPLLAGKEPDRPAILAGRVPYESETLFLKFTGPVALLKAERPAFVRLLASLHRRGRT